MSRHVKIKVRVGRTVCFPGFCTHCGDPADGQMGVRKRIGRVTRELDVPLCSDCAGEIGRLSGEEERLRRLGPVAALVVAALLFVAMMLFLPGFDLLARLAIALSLSGVTAVAIFLFFRKKSQSAARLEKKAILRSVRIVDFSWRATTFEFDNETYARQFIDLNRASLMEI